MDNPEEENNSEDKRQDDEHNDASYCSILNNDTEDELDVSTSSEQKLEVKPMKCGTMSVIEDEDDMHDEDKDSSVITKSNDDDNQDRCSGETFRPDLNYEDLQYDVNNKISSEQMTDVKTIGAEDKFGMQGKECQKDDEDGDKDEDNRCGFAGSVITKVADDELSNYSMDMFLPGLYHNVVHDCEKKDNEPKQRSEVKSVKTEYQNDTDNNDNQDEHSGGEFASTYVFLKSNDDGQNDHSEDLNYDGLYDHITKDVNFKQNAGVKTSGSKNSFGIEDEEFQENYDEDEGDNEEFVSLSVRRSNNDEWDGDSGDTFHSDLNLNVLYDSEKNYIEAIQELEVETLESVKDNVSKDGKFQKSDEEDNDTKDEHDSEEFAGSSGVTKSTDDGSDNRYKETFLMDLDENALCDNERKDIKPKLTPDMTSVKCEGNSVSDDEENRSEDNEDGSDFTRSHVAATSNDGWDKHGKDTFLSDSNCEVLNNDINKSINSAQTLEVKTLESENNYACMAFHRNHAEDSNDDKDKNSCGEFASLSVLTQSTDNEWDRHSGNVFLQDFNSKVIKMDVDSKQVLDVKSECGIKYATKDGHYQDNENNIDDDKDGHTGGKFASSLITTSSNVGRDNHSEDELLPNLNLIVLHDGIQKYTDSVQMLETSSLNEDIDNGDCSTDDDNCSETSEECDEHQEKQYSLHSYAKDFFQALRRMKQSAFLTDLTVITGGGSTFYAHSLVLAAVSTLTLQLLNERDEKKEKAIVLHLDPEVTDLGVATVLEFAYTGTITGLNAESLAQIQTAAIVLGVPHVLELCEEAGKDNKEKKINEDNDSTANDRQLNVRLKSIRQLWEERVGCDVEVEAEGRIFRAHKIILSASSDFFHAMFLSGMRESQQTAVSLLMMGAHELDSILQFSYSGEMVLDWACIFQLTSTTLQFQFQPALLLCIRFMNEEMDAVRCLDVAAFAEAYAMCDLLEMADDFVLRHFEDVASTLKFQDLSIEKLKKYLHSDCLCVASELSVFKAVISWIEAKPNERVKEAGELMGTILFSLMTFTEFKDVKVITSWPEVSANALYETLLEDFCSSACNNTQAKFRTYIPKEALVLIGGERITENLDKRLPCRDMWFSNSFRNHVGLMKRIEWRKLGELPDKPRFSHRVGVIKGKLYVVGGRHYYGKDDTMNCTYGYDLILNTWQRLGSMCERRASFALVVLDESMYAIGGERDSEVNIGSVEMYCPIKDSWSLVHPLDQALSDHAACVWNGKIFISGGFDHRYHCLETILLYHPQKGTTYLTDMSQRRAQHCMETLQNYLYIAGGVSDADGRYFDQLACEVYDPSNGIGCVIMPLPVPHVSAASAVLEGKIYIVGGYCYKDFSDTKQVHRYNVKTDHWENLCGTPGPNTYIAACVLPIPSYLRT